MRLAVVDLDPIELEKLWCAMMKRKHAHRYSDIARVWIILDCRKVGPQAAIKRAELLGISSETRRDWFCRDLVPWLARMKRMERLDGGKQNVQVGETSPLSQNLSVADMDWIEGLFLAEPLKGRVYRRFTEKLKAFAEVTPGKKHLKNISYTTVWRLCRRLKCCVVTEGGSPIPERVKTKRKRTARPAAKIPEMNAAPMLIEVPPAPVLDSNVPF